MTAYVIRRLLLVPVTLFGVTLLIFGVLQFLSPIERSALYVRDTPRTDQQIQGVIRRYGLDDPLYLQYWRWLVGQEDAVTGERTGGILRGEFGYSRTTSQPVIDLIKQRFPATLELALWSLIPIIGGGIWLGVIAALHHNRPIDQLARLFSIVGWAFPTFVFGLVVLMIFYARLEWFPPGRVSNWAARAIASPEFHSYTSLITVDALLNARFDIFLDALRHMILPVITLAYLSWALILRVTRSSMLEVLRQDYMTTARAKGVPERLVIRRHGLPNALMPVVTIAGLTVVGLLNGVVVTETIFNYPGIGAAAAEASTRLDVVTVLGLTLFFGFILIMANLIVDLLYAVIDPRVRLE